MKNDIAVLKQAIETYGAEAQLNVAIEEFSELIKEICYRRSSQTVRKRTSRLRVVKGVMECIGGYWVSH